MYAGPISRLIGELSKLPGIGQRTAQRLAFHILRASDEDAFALADTIREVKEKVGLCELCFNLAEGPRCRICEDERRERALICVVEEPADVIPIERTGEYRGVYHVLGGASRRSTGSTPRTCGSRNCSTAVNGEVQRGRARHQPDHDRRGDRAAHRRGAAGEGRITITRLASGLPVGADLEHADEVTLGKALAGRRTLG